MPRGFSHCQGSNRLRHFRRAVRSRISVQMVPGNEPTFRRNPAFHRAPAHGGIGIDDVKTNVLQVRSVSACRSTARKQRCAHAAAPRIRLDKNAVHQKRVLLRKTAQVSSPTRRAGMLRTCHRPGPDQ